MSPYGRACQLCFSVEEMSAEVSSVKPKRESGSSPSSSQANLCIPLIHQGHQSQGGGGTEMRHLNQRHDGPEMAYCRDDTEWTQQVVFI